MPRRTVPVIDRFMAKVDQNGPIHPDLGTRCWDWTASLRKGYPQFAVGDQIVGGHKWSLEHHLGRPLGLHEVARHRCDRRVCVNPEHLEPGTYEQNSADITAHGRQPQNSRRGGRRAPLPDRLVVRLREQYAAGASQYELAALFSIAPSTVRNIAAGVRRKNVGGPITTRYVGDVEAGVRATLTEETVVAMRNAYRHEGLTCREVAVRYGASVAHATNIIAGRTWPSAGGPVGITRRQRTTPTRKAS